MTSPSMVRSGRLAVLAVLGALIALALPAGATATAPHAARPHVFPPVDGLYDHLSVAWWQWVLAQPAATNPLPDPTGGRCAVGQSGPVFFLVGTSGTEPVVRDRCTVPARRFLFSRSSTRSTSTRRAMASTRRISSGRTSA
jgi:hypothetical protein